MNHLYYSNESKYKYEKSSRKCAPNDSEQLYRVPNAGEMTIDELMEAIRDKIQKTLVVNAEDSKTKPG